MVKYSAGNPHLKTLTMINMKRLLLFLLCQGSLDSFSQVATVCYKHNLISTAKCSYCAEVVRYDTLASHLLITHNPPSFGHSIEGYCVTRNGYCTGKHLVYRSKRNWFFGRRRWSFIVVGEGYDVWGCKRKEGGG
jgi:hypothetical protein